MSRSRLERLAPLSGILAVALVVASVLVFGDDVPEPEDGGARILEFWRENDDDATLGAILFALSGVPFLWFAGSVRAVLRSVEGAVGRLSAVAFGGMVVFVTGVTVGGALQFALAESADDVSPAAIEALNALSYNFFFPFSIGLATFMLAVAVSILRLRALHPAFGWTALVLGVAAITPVGFFSFLASGLWVIAASVALYLRGEGAAPAPTAPASSPGSPS